MIGKIMEYFQGNGSQYLGYVGEHLWLSLEAVLISTLIGFTLGLISYRFVKFSRAITFSAQAVRIIPSLAVLFILIPYLGVGRQPALIALVFLGVQPILINTVVGFREVPTSFIEAGQGLGMTDWQVWRKVKFPLAFPFLMNGTKLALVEIIASATLATYIGAGGLGTLIFTGLGLYRLDLLIVGGVSVAVLSFTASLLLDAIIRRSVR
ncbi:ABC transporter permease [Jeotgalibaca sp. A127]|uniref:ABC transporter permease n=1 Tax=Jeotgalibaca sp. A127 TaxID=3457324 RepID=UPI003FD0D579